MSKQLKSQRLIYKIHSSRLVKAKWKLQLSLAEARQNDEIVSLSDSQVLRWIDELNGVNDYEDEVVSIQREIRRVRKASNTLNSRKYLKSLYDRMYGLQFKPDYLHLVIDRNSDMIRACKGFYVNGVKFERLVGTNGGVKESTIVFVSSRLLPELRKRITNGRNEGVPMIPAKLDSYRALCCSGSIPVSMPRGIAVVSDAHTHFTEDIIMLDDSDGNEPNMRLVDGAEIDLDESDGYGLMLPSLAERWSEELKLGYVMSGCNTRMSWNKGMAFTFDFLQFADEVAGTRIIKDAWGNDIDLSNVELILTTSMLKMWKAYSSIDDYLAKCAENHYTFGITKTTPKVLDTVRTTNYQFVQGLELTDDDIDELIRPTIDNINSVLYGDWRKALLFLKGIGLDENSAEPESLESDVISQISMAIMADNRMFDDPHIRRTIYRMIERRIRDAKIGVLDVHANYSIIGGDPYALCQHMFGLEVTGLLKKGELYNRYWSDCGAEKVACFRAPMSARNNIKVLSVASNEDTDKWYKYLTACTMLNAWDTTTQALNGAD